MAARAGWGAFPAIAFAKLAWSFKKTRFIAWPCLAIYVISWHSSIKQVEKMLEEEDRTGLVFMARAGYDVQQVMSYRQRLVELAKKELEVRWQGRVRKTQVAESSLVMGYFGMMMWIENVCSLSSLPLGPPS